MIIFTCQITAKQIGFYPEFSIARIIFALGRTFQNLEKTLKIYSQAHPLICKILISLVIVTWKKYFALGRRFQNLKKTPKIGLPSIPTEYD